MRQGAVTRPGVALLGRGGTKIGEDEHPHGAGAATLMPILLYAADHRTHVLAFPFADFQQRIPQFRLETHAGASALGDDIAIDQTTDRHGRPHLCKPGVEDHTRLKRRFSSAGELCCMLL